MTGDLCTDPTGADETDGSEAVAGMVCFAFGPGDSPRISQRSSSVDQYAKVGGVLTADAEAVDNGTHAIEGAGGCSIDLDLELSTPESNWVPMGRGNNHGSVR